tara:strand:+ start:292 stop:708 length:417 start_codon:yes stop_codon:yes gene_type:complete
MKLFYILIFLLFNISYLHGNSDFYLEGVIHYEKKEFDKAKFKFEQDIVFNPKSEQSYLYLSKIFNKQNKQELEKRSLNTVILLNPQNEEATFNLVKLKFKESDYSGSKKLIEKLLSFCKDYCQKSIKLQAEIENSLKK